MLRRTRSATPTSRNTRNSPRRVVLALGLTLAVLSGCGGDSANSAFERYLDRLARTLAVEQAPFTVPPRAGLPPPRELRLHIAAGNLDALDFLALSGCAVQITIGKRNSSLGRLARASQRLLLELEYLRLAPECIAYQRERGEQALADTLQQAWNLKREQLPAAIYNATLASAEYRTFWKQAAYPAADYPANTSSAVVTAMEAINSDAGRWLAGDYRADNRTFEILLGEVATGDGGALRQALAAQQAALANADGLLRRRMDKGPLCSTSLRPDAANILPNVIRKYFIDGIQPRAAALNRRYHELLPPLIKLEQRLDTALPHAYRAWTTRRDQELDYWALAPRRHVKTLLAIQQPCVVGDG